MDTSSLPPDDFEKLLRWLDPDRDKAAEKYEKIRFRLIRIFSARGCWEPEDLADKTTDIVISKIDWLIENFVGDPALYFYGVGKNVLRDWIRQQRPNPLPPPQPEPDELEEKCGYLDECLEKLSPTDRYIALRYHEGEKGEKIKIRKDLAAELKITQNALRIRVCHIHSRLRECIERLQKNKGTQ